jgi:hypothetical protein
LSYGQKIWIKEESTDTYNLGTKKFVNFDNIGPRNWLITVCTQRVEVMEHTRGKFWLPRMECLWREDAEVDRQPSLK